MGNEKKQSLRRKKKVRVLIVDDSGPMRGMLTSACSPLSRLKVVGHAKDGLEALELIHELKPDVITLDIRMPRMSGIEVLRAIKAEHFGCVVIVLSGVIQEIYRQKCMELGAKHVFEKATEFEKLMQVFRAM
jgi:two-component system chemotaxis response regulator CheB